MLKDIIKKMNSNLKHMRLLLLLVIAKARSAPWMMVVSIEQSEKF